MPKDKSGKFHLNTQKANAADKVSESSKQPDAGAKPAKASGDAGSPSDSGSSTTLHDHGDGTFSTESDGQKTTHPHIGHALAHMGAKHAGGKHHHVHHDGMSFTSHHADDSGNVDGPIEHGSADEAAQDMSAKMADTNGGSLEMTPEDQVDDSAMSGKHFSGF